MKFGSPPLTPHLLCTSLRFGTVGIPLCSLTIGAELSKSFANYLSVSATLSCRGTLRLVTSASCLRFAFGQGSAAISLLGRRKRLDCPPLPILPPPPSWSSSRCSVTAPPFPLSPPPQLAPHCSLFCGRASVATLKPVSVTPVLLAVANPALAHPPATPHECHLHPPFHPAIGHHFVLQHHSGVQVYTLTS